jgi:hypothetical protein
LCCRSCLICNQHLFVLVRSRDSCCFCGGGHLASAIRSSVTKHRQEKGFEVWPALSSVPVDLVEFQPRVST